jgi:hypothetical protein
MVERRFGRFERARGVVGVAVGGGEFLHFSFGFLLGGGVVVVVLLMRLEVRFRFGNWQGFLYVY